MAAARTYRGTLHEVWADAVNQIGGASQTLTTAIPFLATDTDDIVDSALRLDTVTGSPTFTVTYSSVLGLLVVVVANTAGGGAANQATWTLDLRNIHTVIR